MTWIVLDIALVVLVLTGLGLALLRVWRTLKSLSGQVGRASSLVGTATNELAALQTARTAGSRGVRS